jgi:speckle-type POZ protein
VSKQAKIAGPEACTTIVGSCVQFRIDYEQTKHLPIGKSILSEAISAGGHLWRIIFFPHGEKVADKGEYISIFLVHTSDSKSVRAQLDVSIMGRDGKPSDIGRVCETFEISEDVDSWGWSQFMKLSDVEKRFLIDGHITFACTIMVMDERAIHVPPSDIGTHLGRLLDQTDGTDVSFTVDGQKFPAHRAVLAARSPVL